MLQVAVILLQVKGSLMLLGVNLAQLGTDKPIQWIFCCVTYITGPLFPSPSHERFTDCKIAVQGGDTEEKGAEVGTEHLEGEKSSGYFVYSFH